MARLLPITVLAMLLAPAALAQDSADEPVTVQMKLIRTLNAESNGVADNLAGVNAEVLVLNYELVNPTDADMRIAEPQLSDVLNANVTITTPPPDVIAAGSSAAMVIEARPRDGAPFSFTVGVLVDGKPYNFPVQATVTAVLHHDDVHCHWWGCHHDHDHCSTGDGKSWVLLGGVAAVMAAVIIRRRFN